MGKESLYPQKVVLKEFATADYFSKGSTIEFNRALKLLDPGFFPRRDGTMCICFGRLRCLGTELRRIVFAGIVSIALSPIAIAQSPAPDPLSKAPPVTQQQVERDPSALARLRKAWETMGGNRWSSSVGIDLTGTVDTINNQQRQASFHLSIDSTGNVNQTIIDPVGQSASYQIVDGLLSIKVPGTSTQALPPHKLLNMPIYFPLAILDKALHDVSWSIIPGGQIHIDSGECAEITIRRVYSLQMDQMQMMSRFTERHLCIDLTSGLLTRIRYNSFANTNTQLFSERDIKYSNYQQFDAYLLPTSITDSMNGQILRHINITALK